MDNIKNMSMRIANLCVTTPVHICVCIIFNKPSATDLHYYLWMWFESFCPPPPPQPPSLMSPVSIHSYNHQMCVERRHRGAFTRSYFLHYAVKSSP